MEIELHPSQVLYFNDNGKRKPDCKTAPCEPPHSDMEFKGYVFENEKVFAFFVKRGEKVRRRDKPSGSGIWKTLAADDEI